MTQSELSQLIAALRAETQQNAVSPDSLGAILEKMVERIEQASAISPLDRVITLSSTGLLPDSPSADEMRTLYLINGHLYAYVDMVWKDCGLLQGPKGDKGDKGDSGTYIDPSNIEVMNSLASLEGKTTAQKQSMIPDGNTVEEMVALMDNVEFNIKKGILPMKEGTTLAEVGLTAVATSKLTISAAGVVATTTASGYSNFRVAYITQPFSKGDIFFRHGENAATSTGYIRRLAYGWTETDPSTLSTLVGLQIYNMYDKQALVQDVYMQCPFERGYLVYFYYNHSTAWQAAANVYKVWRNSLKDKQDPISYDEVPTLGSSNPVTSNGVYGAIADVNKEIFGNVPILAIKQNICIDWNSAYSTNGSWKSGFTNASTYIFDVSDLRGKRIQCHYWNRANTYPYAFVTDWELIATNESAQTNEWSEIAVLKPSGRNSTSGYEYNTFFTVPEEASHLLLVSCPLTNIPTVRAECIESRVAALESGVTVGTDILALNPVREYLPKVKNMVHQFYYQTWKTIPFLLAHFSDVHGNGNAITRLLKWCNEFSSYIDDIIHTGDAVKDKFSDGVAFWYNVANAEKILNIPGNHDHSTTSDGSGGQTPTSVYSQFIAPYVANWGVQQPANAAENGYNWWFKDYTNKKVRLIGLDCMQRNATQLAWLKTVLADAANEGLTVVIAFHSGPSSDYVTVPCCFCSYSIGTVNAYNWPSAVQAVKDFKAGTLEGQNAAGDFACWISGHTHKDYVLWIADSQLVIGVDAATTGITSRNHVISADDKSQDNFNLLAVDTYRQTVKLLRVGNDCDDQMRKITQCAIRYTDGKVLS